MAKFRCQQCQSINDEPICDCGSVAHDVVFGRIPDISQSEQNRNLEIYQETKRKENEMNNLEFMHKYQLEKLSIQDLSNDQLLELQNEIPKRIETERIRLQAVEHLLRERGQESKIKQKESDRLSYVPPQEAQLDNLARKMSKKGESAEQIKRTLNAIKDLDFSDI